jgi:thiol-disulfide isomerase/thioredoxin
MLLGASQLSAQEVPLVKFTELQARINSQTDKVLIINFWATWCKPCILEMPAFEAVYSRYKDQGLGLLYVSNDWPAHLEDAVKPFLQKKQLKGSVVLIDEADGNSWIPKVDTTWSGAIPATLMVGPGGKKLYFHEGILTETQLEAFVKQYILQP